ncbi:M20/M25/M40 family metallo-hydrolase [Profundibacterium mesophilum]|uniref:Metalloprotease M20 family protein n=1 Tax=Profundibacterium mesophilum KAUST100406-0324 TaxID=1037889 RepID=A0A921NZC7_9RHOB|nr:M20/M25/M40 family metallo-hydrolase [Profundibacterium mesophilum]KAF0677439.1 putative metalloprotease M20 family protein [Profundibacterium mesophilum KAUST100406-0324]
MTLAAVLDRIDSDLPHATERLFELMRIPSISTDPDHAGDCARAAEHVAAELRALGIEAETRITPGHPMVVGHGGSGDRHLLFYGHYDVQPVDPLELWDRDPFDPALEQTPAGTVIRGRGAADDKGQLMTFIEACRAWVAVHGSLPCRITFFLEGEEESGSPSLVPFMEENREELSADVALICDTGMFSEGTPAITTMLRGLVGEEVTITGPSKDLHSGQFGGPAMNPIRVLAGVVAGLHDAAGRVTVPGFYDGVPEMPEDILEQWEALNFDAGDFLGKVGLSHPAGEAGRTPLEQLWARPTCEVNGIWGGYTGKGFKTVLPAKAHAKISFRLVGDQDPAAVRENFRQMVRDKMPPDCTASFHEHGAAPASQMEISDPAFAAARAALSDEWPNPAAYVGGGGSIPIAGYFKTVLNMDSMLIGFGRDDDQIHSPNEKYDMESFHRGTRSWARILDALR